MKTTTLFFIIFLFCFSCTNQNNSPLTQQEREEITTEVNTVINSMIEGMKKLDVSQSFKNFMLNDDFKYINVNGKVFNQKTFLKEVHKTFDVAKKVDFGFSSQDIRIVTRDVAIVTFIYHGTFYFPESTLTFPDCGSTLVMEKTAEGWKAIHFQESLRESDFVITELK